MSFNVRNGASDPGPLAWEARFGRVTERITDYAPDVLALQEATSAHLDELADALPRYGFLGVGNADGGQRGVCEEARARGLDLIGRDLASRADGGPAIVLGDLNLQEDAPALVRMIAQTRLRDSYRVAHPERRPDEATYHAYRGDTQGSRVDFLLVTDDLTVVRSEIVHPAQGDAVASDHFAVTSTVQIPSRREPAPLARRLNLPQNCPLLYFRDPVPRGHVLIGDGHALYP